MQVLTNLSSLCYSHLASKEHCINYYDMGLFPMTSQPSCRALHPSNPPGFSECTLNSGQPVKQLCCTRYPSSKNDVNDPLTPGSFLAMKIFRLSEDNHWPCNPYLLPMLETFVFDISSSLCCSVHITRPQTDQLQMPLLVEAGMDFLLLGHSELSPGHSLVKGTKWKVLLP